MAKQARTPQSLAAAVHAAMKKCFQVPFFSDYGFKAAWLRCKLFPKKAIQVMLNLKEPPLHLTMIRNELPAGTFEGRSGLFDVVGKDERQRVFIVEMQARSYKFVVPRLVFYTAQEYCNLIPKGKTAESFAGLPPVYCICIIKGKFLPGNSIHEVFTLKNEAGEVLYPGIEFHFFELGKFPILRKNWKDVKTDLEKLLYTMKYAHSIDADNPAVKPDFFKEKWLSDVVSELNLSRMSPQRRAAIERGLVKEAAIRESNKLERERERKLEAKRKIAEFVTSLIQDCPDFPDERIARLAGAPLDFVKKTWEKMTRNSAGKNGKPNGDA